MALFKSLFGKKKEEDTDGQEEFFKEDFAPIVKKPASKKTEPKAAEPKKAATAEKKPAAKKAEAKPAVKEQKSAAKTAPNAEKPAAAKKAAAKSTVKAEKSPAKSTKKATEPKAAKPASKNGAKTSKPSAKTKELTDDSPEVKGAVAIQESKATANGKWDIRRAKDGRYFFSLYASNHTVIAYSQIYSSTTAVTTGINSVIANAPKCEIEDTTLKKPVSIPCPKWEIYLDKAGEYRFRLYAPNGLIICHASHGYATKSGCKGGIESIKRFSAEAKVNKSY